MIVAKIKKSNSSEIQISVDDYKDKRYINIREYFKNGSEFLPTKKGLTILAELKNELAELIATLKENNLAMENKEINLSKNYRIQVGFSEYMNYQYCDLRKYYYNNDLLKWLPTKQGITFREELIDEILSAIKIIPI